MKCVCGGGCLSFCGFFSWLNSEACEILVPKPPAVDAWSPHHWTTRQVLGHVYVRSWRARGRGYTRGQPSTREQNSQGQEAAWGDGRAEGRRRVGKKQEEGRETGAKGGKGRLSLPNTPSKLTICLGNGCSTLEYRLTTWPQRKSFQ